MNFQQLRIIRETVRRNFNLTEVANALYTSQSGVSKHIRDLEDELGVELFVRRGKRLLGLTDPGKEMVEIVERVLVDTANIKRLGEQFSNREQGQIVIATTHTQARYVLPHVVAQFRKAYPKVRLTLHQGSFVVWLVFTGIHFLGHIYEAFVNTARDLRRRETLCWIIVLTFLPTALMVMLAMSLTRNDVPDHFSS